MVESEIFQRIPHRPPFLWVDDIVELTKESIETTKFLSAEKDFFKGHYPDYPITPGVILCEAVFQAGAILISKDYSNSSIENKIPVLTRIYGARFKREVKPDSTIIVTVKLIEKISNAWIMKGKVAVNGKTAITVEFACALANLQK